MAHPKDAEGNASSDDTRPGGSAGPSIELAVMEFIQANDIHGVESDVLSLAAAGKLTRAAMLERLGNLDTEASHAVQETVLDAVLFVVEHALVDHQITPAEQATLHRMKVQLVSVKVPCTRAPLTKAHWAKGFSHLTYLEV